MCHWVSFVMTPSSIRTTSSTCIVTCCDNIMIIWRNCIFIYTFCRKSASCTHVSALLHALVAVTPTQFPDHSSGVDDPEATEVLPVTSYACQWKPPRKRKESNLKISEARFEKHVYGKLKKKGLSSMEEFDPRPPEYRGTANAELSTF